MKIKIITIGKIKEDYLLAGIKEYSKRIEPFTDLEVIELAEAKLVKENPSEIKLVIEKESNKIIEQLNEKEYKILLDINGKEFDSIALANIIKEKQLTYSSFTFIIGGSYGTSDQLKKMVNLRLSFGKLTYPHQLMRLVLLEQIYRVFKINNNHSYHK